MSNGGFYPPKQTAEFEQLYYPNSLRTYPKARFPGDFARPVASAKARQMSKSSAVTGKKEDDYLKSQVYFQKSEAIIQANKETLRSQVALNERLAAPKRSRPKFSATQSQQTNQTKSVTFMEKLVKLH